MRRIRYAGLAEEPSYAELADAVQHLDIASASLDVPSEPRMIWDGGLGRSRRTPRPGYYSPSGDLAFAADVHSIHRPLKWALGGYLFTADGGDNSLNLHEAYGSEDVLLPSFTARVGKDVFEHVFGGCVVNQLQLEVSDEFAVVTVGVQARRDSKADLKAVPDLLLPAAYPLSFVDTKIELAGSDRSAKVRSLSMTLANNLAVDQGRGMGSRFPNEIPAGGRDVDLQLGVKFEDTEHLETFWGDADGASDAGAGMVELVVTLDAGDDGKVELRFPSIQFSQPQQQPSGRQEIEQTLAAEAFADEVELSDNTTVNTELLASIHNDKDEVTA